MSKAYLMDCRRSRLREKSGVAPGALAAQTSEMGRVQQELAIDSPAGVGGHYALDGKASAAACGQLSADRALIYS